MSLYRFVQDCFIDRYYQAGDVASTADAGGTLPTGWKPNGAVDPLDTPALNSFYAAGPQQTPLVRAQWSNVAVVPPKTYWVATTVAGSQATKYTLSGLGSGLAPVWM